MNCNFFTHQNFFIMSTEKISPRRKFLGNVAAGAAALGLLSIPSSIKAAPSLFQPGNDADEWFKKVKGKHRIMFDVPRPNGMMPFAWPRIFLMTNQATGSSANDCGVVVVLRHDGIPFAFNDNMWSKYKFGEMFKYDDPKTTKASVRNPFWMPKTGDFQVPGVGVVQIGINELQRDGIMFCVCDAAITVYSAVTAMQMKMDAAAVKKEWEANVLPGVQIVPSGVWAVGRAQENGCKYCFAG